MDVRRKYCRLTLVGVICVTWDKNASVAQKTGQAEVI